MNMQLFSSVRDRVELPLAMKTVLLILVSYCERDGRQAWPSRPSLARAAGVSERCVAQTIKELHRQGFVKVKRTRGRGNIYTITAGGEQGSPVNEVHPTGEHDSLHPGTEFTPPVNEVPGTREPHSPNGEKKGKTKGKKKGGRKRPAPSRAVEIFRKKTERYPNKEQQGRIDEIVDSSSEEAIERWERAVGEWLAKDYKKTNVPGMLDWFQEPERMAGKNSGNGHHKRRGHLAPLSADPGADW